MISDFNERVVNDVTDIIASIKVTLSNIKKYKNDKDLNLDLSLIYQLTDRETRLKSKLDYFNFVAGNMSEKEAEEYIDKTHKMGGNTVASMLGDIRDYANVTVIRNNLLYAEEWILDVDKIIVWVNRGKSQMPTEEEKKQLPDFFKLEKTRERTAIVQLGETVDIEINTNYMKMDKVTEYLEKKIPDKFVIKENSIYISKSGFTAVSGFVTKFTSKSFMKII